MVNFILVNVSLKYFLNDLQLSSLILIDCSGPHLFPLKFFAIYKPRFALSLSFVPHLVSLSLRFATTFA